MLVTLQTGFRPFGVAVTDGRTSTACHPGGRERTHGDKLFLPPSAGFSPNSCCALRLLHLAVPCGGAGDQSPPCQASCATSGGCRGCDGVTLTSSGFQSPGPARPRPSGTPGEQSKEGGTGGWMSPKATFQGAVGLRGKGSIAGGAGWSL